MSTFTGHFLLSKLNWNASVFHLSKWKLEVFRSILWNQTFLRSRLHSNRSKSLKKAIKNRLSSISLVFCHWVTTPDTDGSGSGTGAAGCSVFASGSSRHGDRLNFCCIFWYEKNCHENAGVLSPPLTEGLGFLGCGNHVQSHSFLLPVIGFMPHRVLSMLNVLQYALLHTTNITSLDI